MLGIALALLLGSLLGHTALLVLFAGVVATHAWSGGRRSGLAVVTLAALAANDFLLAGHPLQRATDPITLALLAAYALEGILASSLVSALRARPRARADVAGDPRRREPTTRSKERYRLLLESSRQSRERFLLLLECVKDYAIFMLDRDGRIASWSPGAERILGYRAEEILGRHCSYLDPEEAIRGGDPEREVALAAAEGRCEGEAWRRHKDGSRLWAHFGLSALRDEAGELHGFAVVLRDISEKRRAEEELRRAHDELEIRVQERTAELARANDALQVEIVERMRAEAALREQSKDLQEAKEVAEAASRAKDQFLAVLSHELRTPLTPVLLAVSAMLDAPPDAAELRSSLEMILHNIELEARLIDDLLDLARAAHGRMSWDPKPVDAHAAIHEALAVCGAEIRTAGIDLVLALDAAEHHLEADPARLQQVLWNLIKNAVKFTPPGGSLAIRTRNEGDPRAGSPGVRLLIEVSDTGIGIEPDVLPRIFDAFEQGSVSLRRRYGGLGLGLAISRSVTEAHGGRLVASSEGKDRGSTFTIDLPTIPGPTPAPPPTSPPPPLGEIPRPRALRILLVEDNKDTLRFLTWILGRQHTVHPAADLATALGLAATEEFDLVLSDIELPDGSGLELMHEMRKKQDIPGIAMSGFGTEDDIRSSRSAGFLEHLTKPIDHRTLETVIQRVVDHSRCAASSR